MSEKIIEKIVDKYVDIDFDFADISDKINYSRYENLKPAPRLKYFLVGSLSAAAVAVLAVTVVIPFTIPKYNAAAPAVDKAYNMPDNTQQGGAAYVPSHLEENDGADSQKADSPSFDPAEGQETAHGGAAAPVSSVDQEWNIPIDDQNKDAYYSSELIEKMHELNEVETWKIVINEAIATLVDEDGNVFELDEQVVYRDKGGDDIALSDFTSGEAVLASFSIVDGQFRVVKVKKKQ